MEGENAELLRIWDSKWIKFQDFFKVKQIQMSEHNAVHILTIYHSVPAHNYEIHALNGWTKEKTSYK